MIDALRKKALLAYIVRILLSVAFAFALLYITDFAIVNALTEPIPLDITADPASYEGKYVTIDVENFMTDYVEHTTTTTAHGTHRTSTTVEGNSYIVFNAFNDYEADVYIWYYYSIFTALSMQDEMYQLIDDTWGYWQDETYTVEPPAPVTLTGTWTRMTGEQLQYYQETLEELGVEADVDDIIYNYTLATDQIGGVDATGFWVMMVGALLVLLYAVYTLVGMFTQSYTKKVDGLLQSNNRISMGIIDSDFASARKIGKRLWIGRTFTIWMDGYKIQVLENSSLVWAHFYRRNGRYKVTHLKLYDINKKLYNIPLSQTLTTEALEYYSQIQPQMVTGYSQELEHLYKKEYEEFLKLKYRPAQELLNPFFQESAYSTD